MDSTYSQGSIEGSYKVEKSMSAASSDIYVLSDQENSEIYQAEPLVRSKFTEVPQKIGEVKGWYRASWCWFSEVMRVTVLVTYGYFHFSNLGGSAGAGGPLIPGPLI